jgi:hypothetical protein
MLLLVASASASSQLPGLDELSDDRKNLAMSRAIVPPRGGDLSICRGHLCNKATEWLVGLLGKIAVQYANLL